MLFSTGITVALLATDLTETRGRSRSILVFYFLAAASPQCCRPTAHPPGGQNIRSRTGPPRLHLAWRCELLSTVSCFVSPLSQSGSGDEGVFSLHVGEKPARFRGKMPSSLPSLPAWGAWGSLLGHVWAAALTSHAGSNMSRLIGKRRLKRELRAVIFKLGWENCFPLCFLINDFGAWPLPVHVSCLFKWIAVTEHTQLDNWKRKKIIFSTTGQRSTGILWLKQAEKTNAFPAVEGKGQ